jgi:hypothetical protein
MIIDLIDNDLLQQVDLEEYFSDPINVAKALVLAKHDLPGPAYLEAKKHLMAMF